MSLLCTHVCICAETAEICCVYLQESFDRQFPAMCFFEWASVWKVIAVIALMCGAIFAFYSSVQFLNPDEL